MVEPTKREVDEALATSMHMFERVQLGEVAPIEPRSVKHMLLALDGSTQDATATEIAHALARRFSAEVSVLALCADSSRVAAAAVKTIGSGTVLPAAGDKDSFEEILAAAESAKSDLVLSPCPFGRDFEQIGPDSAGTVVDVLIARSAVPVLVVREPHKVEQDPFRRAALTLVGENAAASDAAAWAATLVAPGGHFELVLVLEDEFHDNVTRLLEMDEHAEPTSEELAAALKKTHVRLHRGLQKSAAQLGFDYRLSVMPEDEARDLLRQDFAALSLILVALERPHHVSQGYASHTVRQSRQPVLVVPVG